MAAFAHFSEFSPKIRNLILYLEWFGLWFSPQFYSRGPLVVILKNETINNHIDFFISNVV